MNHQRRMDDAQRRPGEQYTPRLIPTAAPRFGEVAEAASNLSAAGMAFPISGYQLSQGAAHHGGPVASSLAHGPVGLPGAAPPQSLHTQTAHTIAGSQPMASAPLAGGGQQQQQQFQRLKVEDALSYLDQVKLQFGNQPQVYNDFLDIMKEFKSQTIDTPGVINRVSNLFKGHPDLIVGFNTFLPPGYKIEVQCETINVHQPGQQVMSIAALAQSQAAASGQRKQGISIWDVALASQASANQQKVGGPGSATGLHHSGGPLAASAASSSVASQQQQQSVVPSSDHRSYHQSPRPTQHQDSNTATSASGGSSANTGGTTAGGVAGSQGQGNQQQGQGQGNQQQQPPGQQPVEFNHAINYVNKIKNRFQGQPDIYKQFLEILHTYQKEQRLNRDAGGPGTPAKPLTESEVYQQVANLFKNQEDLLAEFGQFLPDANGGSSYGVASFVSTAESSLGVRNDHSSTVKKPGYSSGKTQTSKSSSSLKRPAGSTSTSTATFPPPAKKKLPKDYIGLADASKTGTLTEYAFFDKVRKALRHQEVYDNFLRSIILFNQEIVTKQELVNLAAFFLTKFPDLFKEFKDLLGVNEQGGGVEPVPHGATHKERISGDLAMEIDFNTCKRYGASYRGIPTKYVAPKCSGRTALCKEVLNDTWVSFPTWSEDSSFVTSRKTQYEENIYKCEDERFELDYVIETNSSTIKCLEGVNKKLARMPQEEAARFRLENSLGGTSDCINRNSIHRIYGDKAIDIIEGLKKNPLVAVPLVIRRLKAKEEEWREAQKQFNKLWKEQNEKFYLKSLDHQCANFKQHDIKAIRSKSLLNQIESIYDERVDNEESPPQGPMMSFTYDDRSLIEDAGSLIIHHVKRQTGVDKETKTKIKVLVKHFVPDLFFAQRGELSDDDVDPNEDGDEEEEDNATNGQRTSETSKRAKDKPTTTANGCTASVPDSGSEKSKRKSAAAAAVNGGVKKEPKDSSDGNAGDDNGEGERTPDQEEDDNDRYCLFYTNSTWYVFLRLHQILCSRLLKAYTLTQKLIQEEELTKGERKESVAKALRLRSPLEAEVHDYYPYFLDMVRAVLDGNLESSQYEDTMREMYGIEAFQLFTVDKLVQNTVRQVQHLVIDDIPSRLTQLYEDQKQVGAAGGRYATRHQRSILEHSYLRQAEALLGDESLFKFAIRSLTATMEIDMLDPSPEVATSAKDTLAWSSYITDYAAGAGEVKDVGLLTEGEVKKDELRHIVSNGRPIYLVRNKKRNKNWHDFQLHEERENEEDDEMEGDASTRKGSKGKVETEVKDEPPTDGGDQAVREGGSVKMQTSADQEGDITASGMDNLSTSLMQDAATLASLRAPVVAVPTTPADIEDIEDKGQRSGGDSDGGLGDDEEEEQEDAAKRKKKSGLSPEDSARRTIHTADSTSVKLSQYSYRHLFVSKTGFIMLVTDRLARTNACHKRVTQRKYRLMSDWIARGWETSSLDNRQREECTGWMLGRDARDLRPNRTTARQVVDRHDRTPYRTFTRYCVDWVAAAPTVSPSSSIPPSSSLAAAGGLLTGRSASPQVPSV